MKKLLLLPTGLFPYVIVFFLYCLWSGFLMEGVTNIFPILGGLGLFWVLALVCAIVFFRLSAKQEYDPYRMALTNLVIKCAHIPAYVGFFLLGAVLLVTIFFAAVLILWLVDCATIVLSGLVGAAAVQRNRSALSKGSAVAHTILQFVFCADLVSAVILFVKAQKTSSGHPAAE